MDPGHTVTAAAPGHESESGAVADSTAKTWGFPSQFIQSSTKVTWQSDSETSLSELEGHCSESDRASDSWDEAASESANQELIV